MTDNSTLVADGHILTNARRLRDYGLVRSVSGFPELVAALKAYDDKVGGARSEEMEKLQIALSKASAALDPETLDALLCGDISRQYMSGGYVAQSGKRRGWHFLNVSFTIVLGFVFLLAALHFTRTTIDASALVSKINQVLSVDFQARTDSLVSIVRSLTSRREPTEADVGSELASRPDDPEVINRATAEVLGQLEDLQYRFSYAEALMEEMQPVNTRFGYDSPARIWAAAKETYDRIRGSEHVGIEVAMATVTAGDHVFSEEERQAVDPTIISTVPALSSYSQVVNMIRVFMYRDEGGPVSPLFKIMNYELERDELIRNIEVTNKWTLPVVYGALGAVLYVLARHFDPFTSSLSFARILLRVAFAMFVAVTISMLFVPSNIMALDLGSSPTIVFLFCFIAGYSTDTFIRLLGQLNTYIALRSPAGS